MAFAGGAITGGTLASAGNLLNIPNRRKLVAEAKINAKYSLMEYSEHQKENWKNSNRIVVYDNNEQLAKFISDAISDKQMDKKMYFGAVSNELAREIKSTTGLDVENYNLSLGANEIRKIIKDHGDESKEASRGQRAITADDFSHVVDVVLNADSINISDKTYNGKPAIEFVGEHNGKMKVVAVVSDKRLDLFVQTMYANAKKENLPTLTGEQAPINTPEANSGTVFSDSSISQNEDVVNTEDGEYVFYDVADMKPQNFSVKKEESHSSVTPNKSFDTILGDSSTPIIPQSPDSVKGAVERITTRTDTVNAKAASQGKTATVADYAAAYGDQAQAVISTYNLGGGTQDAAIFAREYELAYSWGESGVTDSYITKPNAKEATSNLTDAQRELAYSAGKDVYEAQREADVNTRQAAVDKAKAEAKARIADRQRDNAHPTTDTSKKLLKNESVSGIIEPKTNQTDEVNNYGDTRKHDNIGETQLRQNEEDGVHGRGDQKDLVGDSEYSGRTDGKAQSIDRRSVKGEPHQQGSIKGVYHGTPYQFTKHEKSYIDLAIHYGTLEQAQKRISGAGGRVIESELLLSNPVVAADIFGERTPAQYVEALLSESDLTENEKVILEREFGKFTDLDITDMAKVVEHKKVSKQARSSGSDTGLDNYTIEKYNKKKDGDTNERQDNQDPRILEEERGVWRADGGRDSIRAQSNDPEEVFRRLGECQARVGMVEGARAGSSGVLGAGRRTESSFLRSAESVLRNVRGLKVNETDTAGRVIPKKIQASFADTIFKDNNGRLLSLYHWTDAKFRHFRIGDIGFHFGTLNAAHDTYVGVHEKRNMQRE